MIIVTGAAGFIGSNLVARLSSLGYSVLGVDYVLDRPYNHDLKDYRLTLARDFYSDLDRYFSLYDVEMVFHEGAISSTTETSRQRLFEYNYWPSQNLIYHCRSKSIPIQYASSASVYGNPKNWNLPDLKPNPLNEYAKSKLATDQLVTILLPTTTSLIQGLRYFNVYGPNEDHKGNQSSPYHTFTRQLIESGRIRLFEGSREFYRDFVPVEEVIRLKLLAVETQGSGIFDVGTGSPKSFYDVAVEVCRDQGISDPSAVIDWVPMPPELSPHYQKYSCANLSWLPDQPSE